MTVIAMTHETGTQGREIAARLAQRLGVDFADEHFLGQRIADRLVRDKGHFPSGLDQVSVLGDCLRIVGRGLRSCAAEEIMELAAYDNILMRGWGAASLLADTPNTFCIRLYAPMRARLRVIAARKPAADARALQDLIEQSDASLSSNLEPVLGADWRTAKHYHLVLNTELQSVDASVDRIACVIDAATRRAQRAPEAMVVHGLGDQPVIPLFGREMPATPCAGTGGRARLDPLLARSA